MPNALVRRPSPRLAEGLVTHIERKPVDADLAVRQWHQYVDTLAQHGWIPVEVPPIDECPDGVFIEDTMVVYGDLAVIARAGANERRPEAAAAEQAVRDQGYRIAHVTEPGTFDGGDILKVGKTVYVGLGGRTNAEGIRQLTEALGSLGADVRAVPVQKVLHLKSAVTALPDGTVIGYEPLVDDPTAFDPFRAVPEEAGSHVVLLGEDRLLMAASAPKSAELFTQWGYTPVVVDISEFEKIEGCVTCLSVRLR
ncbi:N(G),N(G)-dimethylarginine dimethylaminohydrolase [Kribbella antibiotica]|uniref:N(G),N(G)-dimethylarginine dimethylaminohydrolase n=1 Tax=Kribbella antibiotica TaxID=190195 RepID=A0A4V2YQP9_9ACTN|nr:dimethylargininase [Kribbella antibiotica]TDD62877.1 N(G),N(G)-dimethylarginine dimethylaminohydrolase [Kribbella antibiotica]